VGSSACICVMQLFEPLARQRQAMKDGALASLSQSIHPLSVLTDHPYGRMARQCLALLLNFARLVHQLPAHAGSELHAQAPQRLPQFGPIRHDKFGRCRRRGGSHVGDKIGDGEVGLVSHATHYRGLRRRDRAGDPLIVEGPQLLQRSATSAPGSPHPRRPG